MALDFIMIDNNELNCFIIQKMLANINAEIPIKTFVHAQEAYEFINNKAFENAEDKTVILLDIHMPLMDGFEFLNEFEQLPDEIKGYRCQKWLVKSYKKQCGIDFEESLLKLVSINFLLFMNNQKKTLLGLW